jgi:hypothetical protein
MKPRLSADVSECEIHSGADRLLGFGNLMFPKSLRQTAHYQQTAIEQQYVNSRNVFPGQMPHLESPGRAETHARDGRILAELRLVILASGDAVRSGSVKIQKHAVVLGAADRFDPSLDYQQQLRPGMRLH